MLVPLPSRLSIAISAVVLSLGLSVLPSAADAATSAQTSSAAKKKQPTLAQKKAAAQRREAQRKLAQAKARKRAVKKTRAVAQKQSIATKRKVALSARKARQARLARDPHNRMSEGARLGLRSTLAEVALNSSAALVIDQISGEVLVDKNPKTALPIASITKLMTALVVADADLDFDEMITITGEDADLEKNASSRLAVGTTLTRGKMMHLALMSSENRAAHSLGRTYPGGMDAFVAAMNAKAREIGMLSSAFTEPTGLNPGNKASPEDLVKLIEEAYRVPEIREFSTDQQTTVLVNGKPTLYRNSNALAHGDTWALGLSKTGFIREAGRCLVMQANIDGRPVVIVMLDAAGKSQRLEDAEKIRQFVERQASVAVAGSPS